MKYTSAIEIAHRLVELDGICHGIGAIDYSTMGEQDNNVSTGGLKAAGKLDELIALRRVVDSAASRLTHNECEVWWKYRTSGTQRVPDNQRALIAKVDAAIEEAASERGLM